MVSKEAFQLCMLRKVQNAFLMHLRAIRDKSGLRFWESI